jgi:hypothetical protein
MKTGTAPWRAGLSPRGDLSPLAAVQAASLFSIVYAGLSTVQRVSRPAVPNIANGAERTAGLPLPTLLSQVLVAFIIEFDNEFEHRTPHRTTLNRSGSGPWLTSMVMWWNCMRFVREGGITVGELKDLARTQTNWNGMES